MINYSNYPFLPNARTTIQTLEDQTIYDAAEHIECYTPVKNYEIDIPIWLASTIILRNLSRNFITRKFVNNYGKLFESYFLKDILNKDLRTEIFHYFEIMNNRDAFVTKTSVKIHHFDYLDFPPTLDSKTYPNFSLVNSALSGGYVTMELKRFVYLVRLSVEQKLFQKIKSMKEYTGAKLINEVVTKLKDKYPTDTRKTTSAPVMSHSIKELIDLAYKEHHLTHQQRIKLGIYLQANNYDEDYILDIFRQLSDWNEKVTRYQLNSLKRYIKD